MYNINLVEDDKNISDLLTTYLTREGYLVNTYSNVEDATQAITSSVHLWLLDIMLGENIDGGYQILREIRKKFNTPVIFVSAKDQEIDRINGLELGGDDYIPKPFSPREVVLKVNKLIARVYKKSNIIKYGDYLIDFSARKVTREQEEIPLTIKEFDLLLILLKNIGNAIPRSFLLTKIWEENYFGSDRVVDDLVRRLRTKLTDLNIETIYGYGYRLA